MFRVGTVVQVIVIEFNGTMSEKAEVVAITKTVLNLNEEKRSLGFIGP
jgi:hypothetical protein